MKKENVLEVVQNSVSSIFTKDDVLKLITSIEQEQQTNQVYDLIKKLQDLQENISYRFQNLNSDEIVDYDSVEFSIGYNNRIEVDDVRGFNFEDSCDNPNTQGLQLNTSPFSFEMHLFIPSIVNDNQRIIQNKQVIKICLSSYWIGSRS